MTTDTHAAEEIALTADEQAVLDLIRQREARAALIEILDALDNGE